jgi:hypothetical protein
MTAAVIPVRLPIRPWFCDHCFNGRAILPAVEAMRVLAETVRAEHPVLDVRIMHGGRFARFLEIPPDQDVVDILVELAQMEGGAVRTRLCTRKQLKTMTRLTEHCELIFGAIAAHDAMAAPPPAMTSKSARQVSAERIYRELVPFGPAYRTLQGDLNLTENSAEGILHTPNLPLEDSPLGSPFPFDGAMHAACVHGQRLVDFVPFPVGFTTRIIAAPTLPGEEYVTTVHLRACAADELVYDLWVLDQEKQVRETLSGLRMRDVSSGRIKPPAWIKEPLDGRQSIPGQGS